MVYRFADYELDEQLYQLRRHGAPVALEPKVFDVLVYLVQHSERVVSKDELLDKLWPGQVVGENALTRCIRAARAAVGDDGAKQEIIETQHGRGYRFIAPLAAVAASVPGTERRVPSQEEERQKVNGQSQKPVLSEVEGAKREETERDASQSEALGPRASVSALRTQDWLLLARSWPRRSVVLLAVGLLIGTGLTVHYLSSLTLSTQHSALVTEEVQPPSLTDKPSIAVLPFANLSDDPKQEYFAYGISTDLEIDLSKLSGLMVIARQSTVLLKDKAVDVQEASKRLGVRYLVQGSVRKIDERLLITAQLVDGVTGRQVWAERYDRPPQDLFAVQEEVRRKIVVQLGLKLTPEEEARLQRSYTPNLEAYNYVAQAREAYVRITPTDNARSRECYKKAIALDPSYAVAYAGLGFTYAQAWGSFWVKDAKALDRAFELAQKALTLDGSSPVAHELLGAVYLYRDKQLEQAIAEEQWAVAHSPNWFSAYIWLGNALTMAGRPEEAITLAEPALRLSPLSVNYLPVLGNAYRVTRQYEKAIATYQKILAIIPHHPQARAGLAAVYSELGREEEAQATMPDVLKQNSQITLEDVRQRLPYKDTAELERHLNALRKAGLK